MDAEIRNEVARDVDAIDAVTTAAFLAAPPNTDHTEQFIVKALRKAGKLALSLVAELDGTVVGHVTVSPVSISDGAAGWHGIGPISVLPQCQGQGIGSFLMNAALQAMRDCEAAGCVVLGEPGLVLAGVPPWYFQAVFLVKPCHTARLRMTRRSACGAAHTSRSWPAPSWHRDRTPSCGLRDWREGSGQADLSTP